MNRRIRKKWRQHKPMTMTYSERRTMMRLFQVMATNIKHASRVARFEYNFHTTNEACDLYKNWGIDNSGNPVIIDYLD